MKATSKAGEDYVEQNWPLIQLNVVDVLLDLANDNFSDGQEIIESIMSSQNYMELQKCV